MLEGFANLNPKFYIEEIYLIAVKEKLNKHVLMHLNGELLRKNARIPIIIPRFDFYQL